MPKCGAPQRAFLLPERGGGDKEWGWRGQTTTKLQNGSIVAEEPWSLGVLPRTLKVVPLGFGPLFKGSLRGYMGHIGSILRGTFRGTTLGVRVFIP